jgi:hypothetical protein
MAPKKSFLLRIDPDLWNDLQTWAADELRSVNGQIEYVLRQAIKDRRGKAPPPGRDGAGVRNAQRPKGDRGQD